MKLTLEWDDDEETEEAGVSNGSAKPDVPKEEDKLPEDEEHFASAEEEEEDGDVDDDWEKVEADDEDEDDHGVRPFSDSKILDADDAACRKRKADDEPQR